MAFEDHHEPSRGFRQPAYDRSQFGRNQQHRPREEASFDILDWYPKFQSCYRYFIEQAQHSLPVQSLAAFVNILLPCQKQPVQTASSSSSSPRSGVPMGIPPPIRPHGGLFPGHGQTSNIQTASLVPYIRRLVATGFDQPGVLHGFFGDDWLDGIGPLHEIERRNYLFASKSGSWLEVKSSYDMLPSETIPFLKPLQNADEKEILAAEANWSDWLAMQDWMVGPRAPSAMDTSQSHRSPHIKRESGD